MAAAAAALASFQKNKKKAAIKLQQNCAKKGKK